MQARTPQTTTPTVLNDTTAALTERGHLAVQLFRVRDRIRALGPADRAWAEDALAGLLVDILAPFDPRAS
jgi:hypothetical protein